MAISKEELFDRLNALAEGDSYPTLPRVLDNIKEWCEVTGLEASKLYIEWADFASTKIQLKRNLK